MNVCMYVIDELKNYCTDSYENWYIYEFFHGEGLYNMLIDATPPPGGAAEVATSARSTDCHDNHYDHYLIPSATLRRFINSKASRRSCIIMPPKRRAIGRSTPQARKRRALRASESDEQRALKAGKSSSTRH
ncbi:hypothetical protein TNCV_2009191 [Trichonephila clavipes]|nr:hypothetical protein TNCV_2009191 [Trichonephila clavipes]